MGAGKIPLVAAGGVPVLVAKAGGAETKARLVAKMFAEVADEEEAAVVAAKAWVAAVAALTECPHETATEVMAALCR